MTDFDLRTQGLPRHERGGPELSFHFRIEDDLRKGTVDIPARQVGRSEFEPIVPAQADWLEAASQSVVFSSFQLTRPAVGGTSGIGAVPARAASAWRRPGRFLVEPRACPPRRRRSRCPPAAGA